MTTTIERAVDPRIRLTFGGQLRSEWIKLRTLRSTWWAAGVTVALMAGIAALAAWGLSSAGGDAGMGAGAGVLAVTIGHAFAQLAVGVLAVLVISGEYSTGMIRSTFAASPRRLPVYLAKALMVLIVAAVIALVGTVLAVAFAQPLLSSAGMGIDFSSEDQLRAVAGQVAYLVLVALFAFGVGALVKNSAAGIVVVVGTLFALPIVVQIVASLTQLEWLGDVYEYLPSVAGQQMIMLGEVPDGGLGPLGGLLVLGGYALVALVVGGLAVARRDD